MYERFNWSLWRRLGGQVGSEPYCDHIKSPSGRELFRAYADADIYNSWNDFREQSLLAIKAHQLMFDPRHEGQYIHRPHSEEITDTPHYLIEDCGDYFITWINCCCPSKLAFEAEKMIASMKLDEIKAAKERFGDPLWRFQVDFPTTQYASCTNEPEDSEIQKLLRRNGIR